MSHRPTPADVVPLPDLAGMSELPTADHPAAPAHRPPAGLPPAWVMAAALVAVAANLRVALASVPPLVETIAVDLHLSNAAIGGLTTLPVLCMGLFAPGAQWLSARIGATASVLVATGCLALGSLTRLGGGHLLALYGGTFLAGVGVAIAGTLLPRLVKALFAPERTGLVTGLYMLAMMGGAAVSSAVSVPLADRLGSWQASLASWALLALLGLLAWTPFTVVVHRRHEPSIPSPGVGLPFRHPTALLVAAYLAVQSWEFYSALAWIAPSYVRLGWDRTQAGYLLAAFTAAQLVSGLLGPVLTDRVHEHRLLLMPAGLMGLVGMLGLLLAPTAAPWLWVVVTGLGQGAAFSLALVLLVDYAATPEASGRLTAMCFFFSYSVASVGPLTMGAVLDWSHGFRGVWLVLSLLMLVQCAVVLLLRPGLPKTP